MLRKWLDGGGGGGRGSLSGFSTWLQHPPPPAHGSPEAGAQFILGRGYQVLTVAAHLLTGLIVFKCEGFTYREVSCHPHHGPVRQALGNRDPRGKAAEGDGGAISGPGYMQQSW